MFSECTSCCWRSTFSVVSFYLYISIKININEITAISPQAKGNKNKKGKCQKSNRLVVETNTIYSPTDHDLNIPSNKTDCCRAV